MSAQNNLLQVLVSVAAFMLRTRSENLPATAASVHDGCVEVKAGPAIQRAATSAPVSAPAPVGNAALLSILKDELFAVESERLSGTLSASEYAETKTGLEAVLRRALSRK